LTPGTDESFPAILARSARVMIGDLEVKVIARDDLIAMKREVVNKQEPGPEKHKRDLDCLKR
jgi:predicted nucleotidyltransferase